MLRDGDCFWVKAQDTRSTDIDCTDMTSAEFMAFFLAQSQGLTQTRQGAASQATQPSAA